MRISNAKLLYSRPNKEKQTGFPRRESNPGRGGESAES